MNGQRGFTLLEVVLAVGIIGLIMTLVISSISVQSKVGQAARRSTEVDQLARTALDIMAGDIEMALKAEPSTGQEGQTDAEKGVIRGKASGTRLRPGYTFSVLTRSTEGEAVVRAVYTTVKPRNAADGPMVILRRERSLLGLPDGPEETVCRRVSRFWVNWVRGGGGAKIAGDVQDKNAQSGQWVATWTGDPPPAAARLELTLSDRDNSPRLFEKTVILLSGLSWARDQAQGQAAK